MPHVTIGVDKAVGVDGKNGESWSERSYKLQTAVLIVNEYLVRSYIKERFDLWAAVDRPLLLVLLPLVPLLLMLPRWWWWW